MMWNVSYCFIVRQDGMCQWTVRNVLKILCVLSICTVFYVWTINCRLLTFIRMFFFLFFFFLYSLCSLLNKKSTSFYYRVSIVFVLLLFHPFQPDSFFFLPLFSCLLPLIWCVKENHKFSSRLPIFSFFFL